MPFSESELLNIAQSAAIKAGKFLYRNNSRLGAVKESFRRDIKIEADTVSEKIILEMLKKTSFSILTEEKGLIEGVGNSYKWIVDPLDGSVNFSRSLPLNCVSIGLFRNGQPYIGVIYDFIRKELFSGISEKKALLNGKKITVSSIKTKNDAVLCTGFPRNTSFSSNSLIKYIKNVQSFKKVRLLGSAALSLAYVASGRADSYFEEDIMVWDVAAGLAIVQGAGGKCKVVSGRAKNSHIVYASNKYL